MTVWVCLCLSPIQVFQNSHPANICSGTEPSSIKWWRCRHLLQTECPSTAHLLGLLEKSGGLWLHGQSQT